jgi:hypothetical protein
MGLARAKVHEAEVALHDDGRMATPPAAQQVRRRRRLLHVEVALL